MTAGLVFDLIDTTTISGHIFIQKDSDEYTDISYPSESFYYYKTLSINSLNHYVIAFSSSVSERNLPVSPPLSP